MGDIYVMSPDGTGVIQLTFNQRPDTQPAWSPDGKQIAFTAVVSGTLRDVYVMNADGSQGRLLRSEATVDRAAPDWSPDGRKIAVEEYDCWDYGPCPRGIVIVTAGGIYSMMIESCAAPNTITRVRC